MSQAVHGLQLCAQGENRVLVARTPDELDADREAVACFREREADRRLAGAVEGMREAEPVEELIRREPTQWHLMQPNWPSDLERQGDLAGR